MATAADFTIADVLAWARTKPADESYVYTDTGNCALCQFLKETGRAAIPSVGPQGWRDYALRTGRVRYPTELEPALKAGTFGGLVARLETLCPETVVPPSEWTRLDAYLTDIETVEA